MVSSSADAWLIRGVPPASVDEATGLFESGFLNFKEQSAGLLTEETVRFLCNHHLKFPFVIGLKRSVCEVLGIRVIPDPEPPHNPHHVILNMDHLGSAERRRVGSRLKEMAMSVCVAREFGTSEQITERLRELAKAYDSRI